MNPSNDRQQDAAPQAPNGGTLAGQVAQRQLADEVAAGLAHELNQPLAAIAAYAAGAATLLRRDPENARQALGIIQAIAGQALRAGVVIEDLRGAVRTTATGSALDPNAVIRAALPLLQSLASQRGVQLLPELRTPIPAVFGDADRLHATLILLVSSALDTITRSPEQRQRLTLSTDCGERDVVLAGNTSFGRLFEVKLPRHDA